MTRNDVIDIYTIFIKNEQKTRLIENKKYIISDYDLNKNEIRMYALSGDALYKWAEFIRDYGVFK